METRQKLLYGVLAVIVLYFAGEWGKKTFLDEPFDIQDKRTEKLEKDLMKAKKTFNRAKKTSQDIAKWEARSLPRDPNKARTLYQEWLVDLVEKVGLNSPSFDSGTPSQRGGIYHSLSFSIRGQGSLQQLTNFLYEFYSADHLHRIQSIAITPLRSAGLLDLSISIEALALANSAQTDRLSTGIREEFAEKTIEDFAVIYRRNVFGIGAGDIAAEATVLTGTPAGAGQPEAWFQLGTDGSVAKLKVGETLQVGQFTGIVAEIDGSDVILEAGGERWLISIGERLNQASALPPEF